MLLFLSLLQPSPKMFELFDDVILLSEGQILYQGPKERVVEFFESCGFKCPDTKGTADFLQEVTSRNDQEQYWADKSKPYEFIPVTGFATRFKHFHVGLCIENELLLIFVIQQMAAGMFKLIAGVCRTMMVADVGGSLVLMVILLGDFVLLKDKIPYSLVWGCWLSPLSYGYNALTVNEMFAPRWMNKVASYNTTRLGITTLNNFNISPDKNWYWIGFMALAGVTILFNVLFTISLVYLRPFRNRQAVTISKERARKMEADLDVTNNAAQRPKSRIKEGCF